MPDQSPTGIGLLNEKPLHAALKRWVARPDDQLEVPVDGYVIDIVRGDLLIEIQTGNFSTVKEKVTDLVSRHRLRLVYPIPREKWLLKLPRETGDEIERRKSPKRGRIEELFRELVSFPELLAERNFSLSVLFTQEEEVRRYTGRRRWQRGWRTEERRLLTVVEERRFEGPEDAATLLPPTLPERFTTADLAEAIGRSRWWGQKMAYCLRKMGVIEEIGRRGRSILYTCPNAA
jgi:hypothetical protein